MKHAAHKATPAKRTAKHASALTSTLATETLEQAVTREVNAMPRTRRERREYAKTRARKLRFTASSAVAMLFGTIGTAIAASAHTNLLDTTVAAAAAVDNSNTVKPTMTNAHDTVSRSTERATLTTEVQTTRVAGESWDLNSSSASLDLNNLSQQKGYGIKATEVDHPTGDTGNAYPFSQCTWWAYTRRHQLGLPVGSYFGNGGQWANSARKLGYTVDHTPEVGAIMVFAPGQAGSDPTYGHVAIVEKINSDGSIVTSECGAVMQGKTYSKTYTNTADFQYIHS
ncbi:CHAP domain-containing protein [Alloscardovia venturai]|uniref:CHAP domain-containing protein n=1 Tax=Alloscardovia venturai TaxID=1769421 RepID=A0ABW2Y6R7_9BIFI